MGKKIIKAAKKYIKAHHIKTGLVSAGIVLIIFSGWIGYITATAELPDLSNLEERIIAQSTQIYDREGKTLLYDIHGEEKRTVIPFEEIPLKMPPLP
jgi:membrane carboxypeptidase/penicillin-binding protein